MRSKIDGGSGRRWRAALTAASLAGAALACGSAEGPSSGAYTIQFPSTAAAVATDTVQLLLFEVPASPSERSSFCETLIQGRKRKDPQKPVFQNAPVNICEMREGLKPITVPYGEKAVLAVAQRRAVDFMLGCAIQTFGDGDAPLPIAVALVDVGNAVPETTCTTVGDYCDRSCIAQ